MFKRLLLWLIPLLVLAVLAVGFVVIPMTASHAASVAPSHSVSNGNGPTPNAYWWP